MSTHNVDDKNISSDTNMGNVAVPKPEKKPEHPLTEIIRFALIALIIVIPIRTFIAQPYIISGSSMLDTFKDGEYIIVDQVSYYFHQPQRGDVVIFRYPLDPSKHFIKRIIAIPGDTITIEGNKVTIKNKNNPEGVLLKEPYVASMQPNTFLDETLKPGEYFVMGDNRDQSSDSRVWGILQEQNITGRAFLRLFPLNTIGLLPGDYSIDLPNNSE